MNVTTDSIKNFRTILIHGLPRQGKTRWSISILAESRSGIYLTHRHEIINHALKIFRSLTDKKTCVWLEGKARSCRTGTMNCESCLMKPDNTKEENISYFKLEAIVEDLLDRYKVLTKERITEAETPEIIKEYGGLCPYYCLKIAATKAKFIFSVPQLAKELPMKELLIIDEDPTIDYFYPRSALICEYSHNNRERVVKIHIPDEVKDLTEVKNIHHAAEIRKAAKFLVKVRNILEKFKEYQIGVERLNEELDKLEFPEFDDPEGVLDRLDDLMPVDETKQYFEPVLFPAPKRFYWESSSNGKRLKLWMVADEEFMCRKMPESVRRILIGSTRAEMFAKQVYGEYERISPTTLPYVNNFAIIAVGIKDTDSRGRKRMNKGRTRTLLRKVAAKLYRNNVPIIMVTGSEEQQERCAAQMRDHRVLVHTVKKEDVDQMIDVLLSGAVAILYANSNISRGVDLDFYDVEIMYNVDFSTPYWSAMAEYWRSKRGQIRLKDREGDPAEDNAAVYEGIREKIISDEMFNLLFRIAPIKGRWEEQAKIVFVPEYYLERIITTASRIGGEEILTELQKALILDYVEDEDTILKIVDLISSVVRRIDRSREIEHGEEENGYHTFDSLIRIYSNSYIEPERDISDIIREGRLVEFQESLIEKYKNMDLVNPIIYENVRNNIDSIFVRDSQLLSREILLKKLIKKFHVTKNEAEIILKMLYIDGVLVRERKNRKIYYRLNIDGRR